MSTDPTVDNLWLEYGTTIVLYLFSYGNSGGSDGTILSILDKVSLIKAIRMELKQKYMISIINQGTFNTLIIQQGLLDRLESHMDGTFFTSLLRIYQYN
jgi:hypothetical protein